MDRKNFKLLVLCAGIAFNAINLSAGDSGCAKCQMIREYNASHPQKEEYYEDYLEEHPNGRSQEQQKDNQEQQNQSVKPRQQQPKK